MSILTPSAFANALKTLYPKGPEEVWYKKSKFLSVVKHTYNFKGLNRQVSPMYQGLEGGNTYAAAKAAKSTVGIGKFLVTRAKDYVIGEIDNETIEASEGTEGAIAEAVKTSMDGALYGFGRSAAFQVMSDGSGTRGTVSSYSAGVITLSQATDSVKFEVGMRLEKKSSGGTMLVGEMLITAISRSAGTLTVTLSGGAADPAANDTLARSGDYTPTGSNNLNGIFSWIPVTAPGGGDNFFGQNRSVDVNRLAGTRWNGGALPIEETIINAEAEGAMHGGSFDMVWMHTKRYAELKKSIQGQSWYQQTTVNGNGGRSGKANIAYSTFVVQGENGPIAVMSDPTMPYAYGMLMDMSAWELACLNGCPHFTEQGSQKLLVTQNADSVEFVTKVYWNLVCHRPIDNVLIAWDV